MSTKPAIIVRIEEGKAEKTEFRFTDSFQIGRGEESDVQIMDNVVSRPHAEIRFEDDKWWVYDLQSTNGIFVDGEKVEQAPLANNGIIRLGQIGPVLSIAIEKISIAAKDKVDHRSLDEYTDYYFGDSSEDNIGKRTMMIRHAFKKIQKKQKKRYGGIIAIFASLFLVAGVWAVYKHRQVKNLQPIAIKNFYQMKRLELGIEKVLAAVELTKDVKSQKLLESYKTRYQEKKNEYDKLTNSYIKSKILFSEKKRLIFQVAQTFGECGVNMPDGFAKEVMSYIKKWKTTKKLEKGIERAERNKYIPKILETMESHDLPPQFFYLALQESLFDINACGPKTRFGIAKGMWQFIPLTAKEYGLRLGPLVKLRKPDDLDDRHDFERSTLAAARYIRRLYETDAQASGLLVMASYNWGARRVIKLIRKMPQDPEKRNFWEILKNYKKKIPKETYDYVFYIVSAAVIGENPRLFGFKFDNPLALAVNK